MSEFTPAPIKPIAGIAALEALDIRAGTIERLEEVPRSEKLMKLTVNYARSLHPGTSGAERDARRIRLLLDGPDKIRQKSICRRFDARIVLDNRKAEHIEVKPDRRTGAFEIRKRVRSEQHFRLHCAHDAVAAAFRAANEFVTHPGRADGADFF